MRTAIGATLALNPGLVAIPASLEASFAVVRIR